MENINSDEGFSCDYYFFWDSSIQPFNGPPMWTPYSIHDNIYLEEYYQKYMDGEELVQAEVGNYLIDFKEMIQKHKLDQWRQRPIIREPKQIVPNILRKMRLTTISDINQINLLKSITIDEKLIYEKKSLQFYKSEYVTQNFPIAKSNEVQFEILKHFNCIDNVTKIDYEIYIQKLKEEIQYMADKQGLKNVYDKDYLDQITIDNFYSTILKMYSAEGFLYKKLNKILNSNKSKSEIDSIKYYYNALLASIRKYSNENNKKLLDSKFNKDGKVFVYRIIHLSSKDIVPSIKDNIIAVTHEFISTSLSKNKILSLLNDESCLLELEIDLSFNQEFLYMNEEVSEFPSEEEVLIKSGSVFVMEKIKEEYFEEIKRNIRIIKGSLLTLDTPGYIKYLKYNNTIKSLYLGSMDLGAQTNTVKILSETIRVNSSIEKLDLPFNNLGLNTEAVTYLSQALKKNYSIKYLNLWDNNLGCNRLAVRELSEAIRDNNSIAYLNLNRNNLGSDAEAIKLIFEALKVNSSIIGLDLNKNNLGSKFEALQILAEMIKDNTHIYRLDLYKNNIGNNSEGFRLICDAIKDNKILKDLNLWENNLGNNPEAIGYLSEAIKENSSIIHLYLPSNNIGNDIQGVKLLCDGIKDNKSLCFLNLYNNDFGSNIAALHMLIEAIKQNISLTLVNLEENKIRSNSEAVNLIHEVLNYKKSIGINY